jgi:hypothetical protein
MYLTVRKEEWQPRIQPWVTYSLIAVELIMHLCIRLFFDPTSVGYEWGFIPARPTLLSLVIHPFLKIGMIETLRDVIILWWIGRYLEEALGHRRFHICLHAKLQLQLPPRKRPTGRRRAVSPGTGRRSNPYSTTLERVLTGDGLRCPDACRLGCRRGSYRPIETSLQSRQ